jgi:hypothetical protein
VVDDDGVATADGMGRRQRRAAQQTTVANDGRAARQSAAAVGRGKSGTATWGAAGGLAWQTEEAATTVASDGRRAGGRQR